MPSASSSGGYDATICAQLAASSSTGLSGTVQVVRLKSFTLQAEAAMSCCIEQVSASSSASGTVFKQLTNSRWVETLRSSSRSSQMNEPRGGSSMASSHLTL